MNSSPSQRDWILNQPALDGLLGCLDADREKAGEKYEKIRQKLMKLFKWRACPNPEDYTDRTIDLVAKKIQEGAELRVPDPYNYFHGVALNLLREYWKAAHRTPQTLEELNPSDRPSHDPVAALEAESNRQIKEQSLICLDECLRNLTAQARDILTRYHLGSGRIRIERRLQLSESLEISLSVLRIRVCRIRAGMEKCVNDCLSKRVR